MSESIPAASPWWTRPIGLGLLGLALMVGGWKLSTWVPLTPQDEQQALTLAEIRQMADPTLADKLDRYAQHTQKSPPHQFPGRLAFLAGLVLFIAAGVRMYQTPPPPAEPPPREDQPDPDPDPPSTEIVRRC